MSMNAGLALTQLAPPPGSRMVVVGGCGGIGRALVTAALAAGVSVMVLDLPASIARHAPPKDVWAVTVDAADENAVASAFAQVDAAWGGLDCLVNLCGFNAEVKPAEAVDVAAWDSGIAGNLRAAFLVSRAALPLLKRAGGGSIVHVSSGIGIYGMAGYGPYAAAKGGLNALAKTLAKENAPTIRVNVVAPSLVDTAFTRGGTGRSNEDGPSAVDAANYVRNIPMARVAEPADIVGPILFLAGPASRYMTGQILHVNGGAFMP
ncbi:MAG: SDR family NAD(P)-dependent oxidoreductase [Rhodospirillaceae bacterium]|nr:SDR family NAD(P)-dependent oxidoreductase [Rhodospirillaceae bacterium]